MNWLHCHSTPSRDCIHSDLVPADHGLLRCIQERCGLLNADRLRWPWRIVGQLPTQLLHHSDVRQIECLVSALGTCMCAKLGCGETVVKSSYLSYLATHIKCLIAITLAAVGTPQPVVGGGHSAHEQRKVGSPS